MISLNAQSAVYTPSAQFMATDHQGQTHVFRAILDTGSDVSFLTQEAADVLQLKVQSSDIRVVGIGGIGQSFNGISKIKIHSTITNSFCMNVEFVILPKIDILLGPVHLDDVSLEYIVLAGNVYVDSRPVDMILGVPDITRILRGRILKINDFSAINTKLGYVICGASASTAENPREVHSNYASTQSWDDKMSAFWDIEPEVEIEEKVQCEKIFKKTLKKLPGRYEVGIPFKEIELGTSIRVAQGRLNQVFKYLKKHPAKASLYREAMEEMIQSGHLEQIPWNKAKNILPHSGVYKPDHLTTKLRIVFDGSAKTRNGRSLNDVMMTGLKLQSDICVILMRFRQHPHAFSADVTKMFRQIRVREEDAAYQCVLWQLPNQPMMMYQINVVVFGLTSSPFLAIRTIQQVAEDEGEEFPLAKQIIFNNFYVDDVLTSFSTLHEATEGVRQLKQVLLRRGFPLNKWVSNNEEILKEIPAEAKVQ